MESRATGGVSKARHATVLLGVALGGFVGYGVFFFPTLVIFMRPVLAEFGWGRTELSLAFSATLLGCAVGAPIGGRLLDRFGIRPITLAASLAVGALMVALSLFAGHLWMFLALTFAIGLCGAPTTAVGYVSVLPQWFNRRLGTAIAVSTLTYGLGNAIWPGVAHSAVALFGWRTGYRMMAIFPVLGGVLAVLLIAERRRSSQAGGTSDALGLTVAQALRGRHLWTMLTIFFLVSSCTLSFMPQIPLLITDRGFSVAQAATGVVLIGVGNLVSRVLCGVLVDLIAVPFVACAFFLLTAGGFLIFRQAGTLPLLNLGCFLVGAAVGTEADLMAYLVRRYLGTRSFSALYGLNMSAFTLGGVLAPPLLGVYFDQHRSYAVPLLAMTLCMLVASLLVLTLGRYPKLGERSVSGEIASIDAHGQPATQ
ncbi:MFS transporter [Paraburkholderia antibiotica]|uniref:MFS transporter n=1 Tax=Paraburkholderia antibiotica TaxID=2728839 RepID=A0A7X9X2L8_9BURK|nr:MFS transporter [Paraburkholderia antibiotica]NML30226.1 MFS transporter [Paraburkholderia antibiotica]